MMDERKEPPRPRVIETPQGAIVDLSLHGGRWVRLVDIPAEVRKALQPR